MRKRRLFTLISISVLLVLSACGGTDSAAEDNSDEATESPKAGLNETTLDDVIAKKGNNEAFYVLIYDAKKEYVKNTELLEAYNEALKKEDMTVFHLNIRDANEQTVSRLDEEYESHSGSSHNPFMYGGIAVVHDGKLNSPFDYYGKSWNLNRLIGEVGSESDKFFDDNRNKTIKKSVQYSLDYTKDEGIELTY